jgi:two-component system, NtrC family, response regulator AtoC
MRKEGEPAKLRASVLVVDDDESMCELLRSEIAARGFQASFETQPECVLESLESRDVDVVVTDLKMRGMNGIELCERIVAARPDLPVVLLTAHGTLDAAVAAFRVHAHDFLTKPPDIDALIAIIERAVRNRRLEQEVRGLDEMNASHVPAFEGIIGTSPPMRELVQLLGRVAAVEASVLLCGESGTGKELAARALHERSTRREGPFVALNCAAIPESLLESELFGHAKGAFTDARTDRAGLFEQAKGGTIFLDEIGELQLSLQPKLLRVLQEHVVRRVGADREVAIDARLIAATNTDLTSAVEKRRFRADLFYRVNVIEVRVPPLRERGHDVLLLAQNFVEQLARRMGRPVVGLTASCAAKLAAYPWPGNVRELANVIERAVALTRSTRLAVEDLPRHVRDHDAARVVKVPGLTEDLVSLEEIERRYIRRVLEATGGNKTLAAQILGVHRRTLYRKDLVNFSEVKKVS